MAKADYLCCTKCDCKIVYAPDADEIAVCGDCYEEALKKYGGHASGCTYEGFTWASAQRVYGPTSHCTCGLDAALAARTP